MRVKYVIDTTLKPCLYYAVRVTNFGMEGELSWVNNNLNVVSLVVKWVSTGKNVKQTGGGSEKSQWYWN